MKPGFPWAYVEPAIAESPEARVLAFGLEAIFEAIIWLGEQVELSADRIDRPQRMGRGL